MDGDWKETPVYMMDFEGSASSGVVEYGVVELRGGRIGATATALCRPSGFIAARDREVHGIGDPETRGAEPFAAAYGQFVEYRRRGVFAAHNRHAENSFLKSTWALPPAVPDWRQGLANAQEWGPWIDTLSLYRMLYPGLAGYGLGGLVERFGLSERLGVLAGAHCPIGRRRPHCALYDALASALLLLRMEEEADLAGRVSLHWLLRISEGVSAQQELF
jgi:DNA polymerase III epsilon subunit-like protein